MSPTIRIIRKLTATMRTFYCISFTDGALEVFDNEAKRNQWFKHYWHECGRTSTRLQFKSVADVEQYAHDNHVLAEYRLNRKLSEVESHMIKRNRAAFLEQVPAPTERIHTTAEEDMAESRERFAELFPERVINKGESYCPPSVWPDLNEMLRQLAYHHGQTAKLDMVLVDDIVTHPEFWDGELDRCIAVFKAEPNQDNMLLVRGAMHIYEWLGLAA